MYNREKKYLCMLATHKPLSMFRYFSFLYCLLPVCQYRRKRGVKLTPVNFRRGLVHSIRPQMQLCCIIVV